MASRESEPNSLIAKHVMAGPRLSYSRSPNKMSRPLTLDNMTVADREHDSNNAEKIAFTETNETASPLTSTYPRKGKPSFGQDKILKPRNDVHQECSCKKPNEHAQSKATNLPRRAQSYAKWSPYACGKAPHPRTKSLASLGRSWEVWAYADQAKNGFLGQNKFYNALRLATEAQSKRDLMLDIVKVMLFGPATAKIPACRHLSRSRRLDKAAPDKVRNMRGGSHQQDPWTVRGPCWMGVRQKSACKR
ncbi:hypothetical protein VNO77_03211 [Canavalia gladiata]|uniref:Uncharacterized protein n=1 Tax=Canavalia gladiata TaxID=3824 RepID=A0AAN9MUB6_CANGL